ncbi:unnamed protein product [Staurois parvus]|uniref:Uncharacterized protein n=1 Tax=Staurois parvus TaxID=386267 RepID=A0ABN9CJB6_9NEOB|nr:unnamed protein product [Staurois parvus]
MGPRTNSSCCYQARNLSWAPVPASHAAARSRVCHGSLYGLPLLLSPSPHSAMCHFQVSSHCCWVPFCHRVLYGLPLLLPPTDHTVAPHSGFGPVTAQMSEVCGDSKIDGTHLHVILTDSIISLSPADSKGI